MITYFNLHRPETERFFADDMQGAPTEERRTRWCTAGTRHLAENRRVSDLALEVKHNDRNEIIIWPWLGTCVLHKRLVTEFSRHKLTGYRLREATIRFRDGVVSSDYRELVVTGWAGVARPESGVRVLKSCPACRWKKYTGLRAPEQLIDWTQWTGDDFFMVWPLPNFVLITERVAELLLSLGARSFELRSLDQVGCDGFTVGRLSNFLPEDLALRYGGPLGLE
jgi:hypothetical protein